MTDEERLFEKLRRIEALFAGAATAGERAAAASARERIRERLEEKREDDPPIEYRFGVRDRWSARLLIALMRRYGLRPFRYSRQRSTTVMARVPRRFVNEILWPEFTELNKSLNEYLNQVTERVIRSAMDSDGADAEVVVETGPRGSLTMDETLDNASFGGEAADSR